MSIPLIQTGPGGNYTTSFLRNGNRLLAVSQISHEASGGDLQSGGDRGRRHPQYVSMEVRRPPKGSASSRTLLDRLLGIDRADVSQSPIVAVQMLQRTRPIQSVQSGLALSPGI